MRGREGEFGWVGEEGFAFACGGGNWNVGWMDGWMDGASEAKKDIGCRESRDLRIRIKFKPKNRNLA